ncbi:MAG: hypothetical protein OXG61_11615 [Chloroflexi bacterium]|nr:hypothetical protein [Chloroflexota bacterium]
MELSQTQIELIMAAGENGGYVRWKADTPEERRDVKQLIEDGTVSEYRDRELQGRHPVFSLTLTARGEDLAIRLATTS